MPTIYKRFFIAAPTEMETLLVPRLWESMKELHAKMDEVLSLARPQAIDGNHPGGQAPTPLADDLLKQLQHANQSVEEYAQRLSETEAKLFRSQADFKRLQEKETRLRSIILDKSGSQRVSDADVIDAFVKLRQMAQGVFKKAHFGDLAVNRSSRSDYQGHPARSFLSKIDLYTGRKDRLLYARARVFRLINQEIFQAKIFGVAGLPLKASQKENVGQHMEDCLSRIEDFMKDEDVPTAAISNWRIETLRCLDHLPSARERPIRTLVLILIEYLHPLVSPTITRDQEEVLEKDLTRLCEDAWDFNMMIRRSREEYSIWMPEVSGGGSRAKLSELSDFMDSMDVEEGKGGSESDEVAYTLFGGLTKHPAYRGEELRILEKAHVVLRRR